MNLRNIFKDRTRPYVTTEPEAMDELRINWMSRRHLDEVLEIEQTAFPHPWDEATFIECLRQRNSIGFVAEHKDRVVGYVIYQLHKSRMHMLNIAVSAESRRQGVGSALIAKVSGKLSPMRAMIFAEVSEWNDDGISFLRGCGFKGLAVAKQHYDTGEDAYVFRFRKEFDQ